MCKSINQKSGEQLDQPFVDEPPASDGQLRAAARDAQGAGGGEGTPPTNRVPDNSNIPYFQPLRWGIDSLYLSFQGKLSTEHEHNLSELKLLAQSLLPMEQAQAQIELFGHLFEVKDKGTGLFPFILEDNCYRIQLSKSTAKSMPMAYVKVSSEYLAFKSAEEVADELRAILDLLGEVDPFPKVSRIDLFVDFVTSVDMESWNRHAWVTKAQTIHQYSMDGRFSGWSVGLGGVMAGRLYNKLLELTISRKDYLIGLWKEAGWNGEGLVWRLEFEFKREILTQFDVPTLSSVLANLNGLWSYATTQWLKLTVPNPDDQTHSRWPIHPLWGMLSAVDFDSDGGPLLRQFSPRRIPSDRKLYEMGFAVLSSFMAKEGIYDLAEAGKAFVTGLHHYVNNRSMDVGITFESYLKERVAVKARRFNSILNELSDDSDLESDAALYRKLSDGE